MKKNLFVCVEEFINYTSSKKTLATAEIYGEVLKKFSNFVGDDTLPEEITIREVNEDFLNYLRDNYPLKNNSIAQHLRITRYFFEYLKNKRVKVLNPKEIIDSKLFQDLQKSENRFKAEFLDESEALILLNYWKNSEDRNNPRGLRNQLIMQILFETGINVKELANLERNDVDLKKGLINIKYKNAKKKYKNRKLEIGPETIYFIKQYFERREDRNQSLIVAFGIFDPYIVVAWPMTSRSIQRMIKKTADELDLEKQVSPMIFRNNFIKKLIRKNYSTKEINRLLGCSPDYVAQMKYSEIVKKEIGIDRYLRQEDIAQKYHIPTKIIKKWREEKLLPFIFYRHRIYIDPELPILKQKVKELNTKHSS